MPENNKSCPLCGGQLKKSRVGSVVNIMVGEIQHLFAKGLTMEKKPFLSFRCWGYQCQNSQCGNIFSARQLEQEKEEYLHQTACG